MSLDDTFTHPAGNALRPFDALLGISEEAFLKSGQFLEESLVQLHVLRKSFGSLDETLGPGADAQFKTWIEAITEQSDGLRQGFVQISETTRNLRSVMVGMRAEMRDLGAIIKLIANVSINARIQGNSLNRQKHQITSFIETLGDLSAKADMILLHVTEAMAETLQAVSDFEAAQISLSAELRYTTFPAIARFTNLARSIGDEQTDLHAASMMIAAQVELASHDVARLVTSLQMGDTLRQQLENVHSALIMAGPGKNDMGLSLQLGAVLAEGALQAALPPIEDALDALDAVGRRGVEITHAAATSSFTHGALRNAQTGENHFATFRDGLENVRAQFATMQAAATRAREQIEIILQSNPALQRIAQDLRVAGINAVITCAKLGEEGRSLRELAQWLRSVTDDCDGTMLRLEQALDSSRTAVYSASDDLISQFDVNLGNFLSVASDLGGAINTAHDALSQASRQFDIASVMLSRKITLSRQEMANLRNQIQDSAPALASLHFLASLTPKPDPETETAVAYLAQIRQKYTMASERSLHDQLVARLSGTVPPPEHENAPQGSDTATEADDLADILF
jgi:methyl-accepting chemotaxis protein